MSQLSLYAEAAVCHAFEHHGIRLDDEDIVVVDQILDIERVSGRLEQQHALNLCYGAWFGQWAVKHASSNWIGLGEPIPPRIVVKGFVCSPLEAVARRMASDQAPTVQSLAAQLVRWSDIPADDKELIQHNRLAWDSRVNDERFVRLDAFPADREDLLAAIDPWILREGPIEGRRILCLAAGGGMHGPLFARVGADVTVVDFSPKLLDIDRQIAVRDSLKLVTIETSMDDLSSLRDSSFDIVIQPVSMSYIRDADRVYAEIARVLKSGGLYVGQHKHPTSLQADSQSEKQGYIIRRAADEGAAIHPSKELSKYREAEMTEFVHSLEALLGGLCRRGFMIEDYVEPPHSDAWAPIDSPGHRARFIPPYMKIKARKR